MKILQHSKQNWMENKMTLQELKDAIAKAEKDGLLPADRVKLWDCRTNETRELEEASTWKKERFTRSGITKEQWLYIDTPLNE